MKEEGGGHQLKIKNLNILCFHIFLSLGNFLKQRVVALYYFWTIGLQHLCYFWTRGLQHFAMVGLQDCNTMLFIFGLEGCSTLLFLDQRIVAICFFLDLRVVALWFFLENNSGSTFLFFNRVFGMNTCNPLYFFRAVNFR